MSTELIGRGLVPGLVEGEALVSHETISGWGAASSSSAGTSCSR